MNRRSFAESLALAALGVAEQIQAGLDRADLIRQADRSHAV